MDVTVQNINKKLTTEHRLEVTRHTKPRHDTRHTMYYSLYKRVQTNDSFQGIHDSSHH